jgi:pimeloyl-ACP methyl ester carboxylesterase
MCAHLASQHPELVSRLILFMPTGLSDFGQQRLPLSAKFFSRVPLLNRFIYRNYQSTETAVRAWLTQYGFVDPAKLTEETVDVFTTCAQQYGAEHAVLNFYAGRLNFDLETRFKMLTQPVTLLWSGEAAFPPLDWAYRFQKMIRHCNVTVLQKVGQLAALEDPAQMSTVLHEQLHGDLRVFKAG